MKNTDEVEKALQILKDNAETDFEKLWTQRYIEALTNPPTVEQVDATHQKFCDKTYYMSSSGHFIRGNCPLHQDIWIYYHGEIPKGYEIHHIDGDKGNNDIYNLQLLTKAEHRRLHLSKPELKSQFEKVFECEYCHKKFTAVDCGTNRFCSPECKIRFSYREESNQVERICAFCGKPFKVYKYQDTKCCSYSCGRKYAVQQHLETANCIVCGKEFYRAEKSNKKYCSRRCATKAKYKERFEKRICAFCGKEFEVWKFSKTKCCSKSCAGKLFNATKKATSTN